MGALTPEEGFRAIETDTLPEFDESIESQRKFKELKDEGLYEPILGGNKDEQGEKGRPAGTKGIEQTTQNVGPIGKNRGMAEKFSTAAIAGVMSALHSFTSSVEKSFRSKYEKKKLSKAQKDLASELALVIASRYEASEWEDQLDKYMQDMTLLNTENMTDVAKQVDAIAANYQIPAASASILFHSRDLRVTEIKEN